MSTPNPYQPPTGAWTTTAPGPYGQPPADAYGAPAYAAPAYGAYAAPAFGAPPYEQPFGGGYGFPPGGYLFAPTYASWIQRVGAYMIDSLALMPYIIGLLVMSAATVPGTDSFGNTVGQPSSAGLGSMALGGLVSFVLWAWNRWFLAGRTGQSLGKKAVGLTMQREADGQPLGVWMAFVRDLAHYVDGFFYLGYLWPIWDPKRQTFSDKLTKTVVVS